MSTVQPPDGHWHRRTPEPIKVSHRWRWFGCTEPDCTWQVAVNLLDHSEVRFLPGADLQAAAVEYADDEA